MEAENHVLTFGKFVALAVLAAALGSVIGTFALIIYQLLLQPQLSMLLLAPAITAMSLVGTMPGTLIIGVPIMFPFRYIVARRPLLMGILVVPCSMGIAYFVLGLIFRSSAFEYRDLEILWCYSGGTALGFVIVLGRWGRRLGSNCR